MRMVVDRYDVMTTDWVQVEVVYALPHQQKVIAVQVPAQSTLFDAIILSKITTYFPEINIENASIGVFSKVEKTPKLRLVQQGDRIEIYRPLLIDPKEARKNRAAKIAKTNEG